MKKGYFISFEGGEGSGKTTIAQLVKEQLEKEGHQIIQGNENCSADYNWFIELCRCYYFISVLTSETF